MSCTFLKQTYDQVLDSVDLAWLVESTMNGGWLGRTARASPDGSAIGELYAPRKLASTPSHPDDFVEPLIEIQPVDVGHHSINDMVIEL